MRVSLQQVIVKDYKGEEMLGPIDLELSTGLIGLIGPNGAGKSTMLKLIAQIYSAASGECSFLKDGLPISLFEAKKSIGYVPQEIALYEDLTVRRFMTYIAGLKCLDQEKTMMETKELSDTLNFTPLLDKKISTLSIGQKRLIMIAQAFLGRPMVVLLDEPFVGLDLEERKNLLRYIVGYANQATILVASHLLEEMNDDFDRIIILKKKQVIADICREELNACSNKYRHEDDNWLEKIYLSLIKSKVQPSTKLDLDRIVFIGRTFEEYMEIFSLSKEELEGKKILDCPSGACSFTAIGNKIGLDITACDIAYYHKANDLKQKGLQDIEHAMEYVEREKASYVWDYFKDIKDLTRARLDALNDCSEDMVEFPDRYVAVNLPVLPFKDGEFDILLSAHLLFMYADRLDYNFHIATLKELIRVSKEEVRIFPLVDSEGIRYEHLDKIKGYLQDSGYTVEEVRVSYEFQKNANSMLKIYKG